jgi:hypothetical protein
MILLFYIGVNIILFAFTLSFVNILVKFKVLFKNYTVMMKYKICLLLSLFLCAAVFSQAQTLYELSYHFQLKKGREDYKALMLRNEDGSGTIRLEYYDLQTKTRNLVEMEVMESYGIDDKGAEDTNMLIYVGLDQKQIIGKVMYKPDNYVFTLNKTSNFYEPDFVISFNDDGSEDMGVLDDAVLLQQEDLTEEKILHYFTESDEVYQSLFTNTTRALTAEEKQTQLFLILVANTTDVSIGKTCVVDKDATYKTFSDIAEFLNIPFKPIVIADKDFSKVNVEKAIHSLQPGKKDIVVFYYSGHGFNQPNAGYAYPFLDLRDKVSQSVGGEFTMNIENIFKEIKAKGARLNLVFSDCCNNIPGESNLISGASASTRNSSIGWDLQNCKLLFMREQPISLLMTAAQKGELSAGNVSDGGIFTFNFRQSIENRLRLFATDVSWNNLITAAQTQTTTRANRSNCADEGQPQKRCVQHPVYKLETP